MAVEEEMCDQSQTVLPVVEVETMVQEKKIPGDIKVFVTSEDSSEEENSSLYNIDISMFGSTWKVQRSIDNFQELHQRLTASDMMFLPLSESSSVTSQSLEYFLQTLLVVNCTKIWYCPYVMAFIDDQKSSKVKVIQVESLTKQFCDVQTEASSALTKLQDAWRMIANLAQRVKTLETSHQRIHNSFKPKEEGAQTPVETPLLAGMYRFDDIMAQAAEFLKDETDWVIGEDGGFTSAISVEVIPVVIPDPPPVIHTYLTCTLLTADIIPVNEEEDVRDEAIGSVITLLEPHQAQVSYRNSLRAFLARVVRRTLTAKVYETGLHALDCFLPDDPIRLTVLLGRTNQFVENWLPTLADKLSVLADQSSDSGKILLSEMMQVVEDDYMAGEDLQPLSEHIVSRVNPSSPVNASKLFCEVEETTLEIDSNGLSSVRFLAFLEEVAQLVGKKELFKRSVLLIRGWWIYETSTYLKVPTKNFLSDQAICVLICSIFNQHHAILFQPLQVLCVFISEYTELDWANCAVTVQGIVPFRSPPPCDDAVIVDMYQSTPYEQSQSEPWLKYPTDSDLLNVALLQKYADILKTGKPLSPSMSCGSKSPVMSQGSSFNMCAFPTVSPSNVPLSHLSPQSSFRELDLPVVSLNIPGSDSSDTTSQQLSLSPKSDSAMTSSIMKQPSMDLNGSDSPMRSAPATETFQRCAMNIVHPLSQCNMVPSGMPAERVAHIVQVFKIGAKDLSLALKQSQGDEPNIQSPFNRFFKAVLVRFGGGWRPDVFKGAQSMCQYAGAEKAYGGDWNAPQTDADPSKIAKSKTPSPPDTIWAQVCYMDLVLTGCVSESAVLALSKEILFERGTLPVGEIGKVLQELTCASSFLGKLKEKFGGLKKFLERFPDEFMICTDHPFNPHVFVKKALNAEELDLVAKGVVPPHLTAKYKKAQRNKKAKPLAGSQSVSPSITHRTLHPSSNNGAVVLNQGYNSGLPVGSYQRSPGSMTHTLGARPMGMSGPGTPTSGFSQMHIQQQQSQFYGAVKGHQGQGQTYSAPPGVSSRYKASQSQSILRASASSSGGNSIGNNSYHQPSSPHGSFQSNNYPLDINTAGPSQARPGSVSGNYPGGNGMRDNYLPTRSNSLGMGLGDRGSDPYGTDRESMFGLNGAARRSSQGMPSPSVGGGSHASPYASYGMPHPLGSNSNPGSERERFVDPSRGGLESHLGLFSGAPSPISSQHMSYDNSSLNSSYDSEARAFPSHSVVSNRNSSTFLRNLDTPQALSHATSPSIFQSGSKPKTNLQIEPPSPGSKYGGFTRPGHHDQECASPTNAQFNVQLPSPKFDPNKWI